MNDVRNNKLLIIIACIIIVNAIVYSILTIPLYRIFCGIYISNYSYMFINNGNELNTYYQIYNCNVGSNEILSTIFVSIGDYVCMKWHLSMTNINYPELLCGLTSTHTIVEPYIQVDFVTKSTNLNLIEFICIQGTIFVNTNEVSLVFFRAYNRTAYDIIGMSTYLIYPNNLSIYVIKLECFCYDNVYINSFETVDLPMLFYIEDTIFSSNSITNRLVRIIIYYTWFNTQVMKDS